MKKINALNPAEREKECTHEAGFRWTGKMPCTGTLRCFMCGTEQPMQVFEDFDSFAVAVRESILTQDNK